jgi:methyl-accepting chemotaxis protein
VLLLLSTAQGGSSLVGLFKLGHAFDNIYLDALVGVTNINKMNTSFGDRRVADSEYILSSDDEHRSAAEKAIGEASATYEALKMKYEATIHDDNPHEKQLAEGLRNDIRQYFELEKKMFTMSRHNDDGEAKTLYRGEMKQVYDRAGATLDEILSIQDSDATESYELSAALRRSSLIAAAAVILLTMAAIFGSMIYVRRQVAGSINSMSSAMGKLASGDLSVEIPGAARQDEIGAMARCVEVFRTNGLEVERMRADQQAQEKRNAEQRKAEMIRLADSFEDAVGQIIETVSSASTELVASAGTLTSTAKRAQELTTAVAAASEEASTNVQSVASATEELSTSVSEIRRQVHESARIASEAVDQARKTNDRVGELSKAAARIGDVVELINTIAGQTNLLALNATIEAARAGEAGRGFAVVASEVKALAEQTAKATGEIGKQINGIQAATQESVCAIKEIGGTIEKLSEISSTIAAAVEEQGAATQEISRNVQQAAQGTERVSSNIIDVQRGASEAGSASSQVLSAAQSLSGDSNRLKLEVGKFLNTVRAA